MMEKIEIPFRAKCDMLARVSETTLLLCGPLAHGINRVTFFTRLVLSGGRGGSAELCAPKERV